MKDKNLVNIYDMALFLSELFIVSLITKLTDFWGFPIVFGLFSLIWWIGYLVRKHYVLPELKNKKRTQASLDVREETK